ncbi:MAG: FAD-dependent oxidoreductase [Thermoplasmatota archaeon]
MKEYEVVIIGGSAAGLTSAITCRRHYPDKKILLIRKEEQVLIPCGIPYIFGTVDRPENNLIPDSVLDNNDIDLIIDEAENIDIEKKNIELKNNECVSYKKLVISTGSEPLIPPIPGIDKKNIFTVKKDINHIKNVLKEINNIENLVILGGGFIGVEFADECNKNREMNVTIIEMMPHCLMGAFDKKYCKEAEKELEERGITAITNKKLTEVIGNEKVKKVKLSDGEELPADALIVSVGVKPNTKLAEKAGLEVDKEGIVVDSNMRTSDPNIFACGDCTKKRSFFTGKAASLWLASVATTEARIAGANLFSTRRENRGAIGVFSTIIGDTVFGKAGMDSETARKEGFEVVVGEAEAANRHPADMPGMHKMKVKLVFNKKNGELLGGQVKGGPSAGEVANTISACIQKKMTVDDISTFQLGTHPAVTASPIAYQIVNAAEKAFIAIEE